MTIVAGVVGAVSRGIDVYLFLFGIVALGELARFCGLFAWLAGRIVRVGRGSGFVLFTLLYALGVVVTTLLSNDTTAVMLTPAVLAVAQAVRAKAEPSLYACAFVANAASFVFPISNPANLVVYQGRPPALAPWLGFFGVPSLAAIAGTYAVLLVVFRRDVTASYAVPTDRVRFRSLGKLGVVTAIALSVSSVILVWTAALGGNIGAVACGLGAGCTVAATCVDRDAAGFVLRNSAWRIVVLVGMLFIVVSAVDRSGGLTAARSFAEWVSGLAFPLGPWTMGAVVTIASALINNLPVALAGGVALHASSNASWLGRALLVAVDLGPNFAMSASLATIIWAGHVRRSGLSLRWWEFMKVGAVVTAPTLALALLLLR